MVGHIQRRLSDLEVALKKATLTDEMVFDLELVRKIEVEINSLLEWDEILWKQRSSRIG